MANNVRIYELAKELKQETKRVIEDLRREGADVSVPSNSVSKELADKLRRRYIPKKDVAPSRSIKVIKKTTAIETPHEEAPVAEIDVVEETPKPKKVTKATKKIAEVAETEPVEVPSAKPKSIVRALKLSKKSVAEVSGKEAAIDEVEEIPSEESEELVEEKEIEAPTSVEKATPTTRVKTLKLSPEALKSGIKHGDRIVVAEPVSRVKPAEGGRGFSPTGRRLEFRATPGETSTPQITYTPPPASRRPGRRAPAKKGDRRFAEKGGRYQEQELDAPRPRSIEERILDQVGQVDDANLKQARLTEGATVRDFAEKLGIIPRDVVQLLIKRGVFATLNQPIGEKLAKELGINFGYDVSFVPFEDMMVEKEFEDLIAADSDDVELPRAPVVTVMGHVDHGKTSLLDAIRSANVAEGEAGGITQHIGAYSVMVPNSDKPDELRRVVFLDTPGHEAFTMMRARGAKATDLVILVVAADDGVMPQTIEAIEHSKAAGVPMIVAINKIDKPGASVDKVKQELAGHGLQAVDWGGTVDMVPVSAKKKENLDILLETVLLQADIMDLKASPTRRAAGVVLEAKLDKGRGSVATVLVQQGTLRVGDPFIVGQVHGRVRAMFSDRGEAVEEAQPATPVEVLGLQGGPHAGDTFQVVADIEKAQSIAQQRQMLARQILMLKTTKRGIESLGQAEVKELLVVLKTDVQGSVEVLRGTLEKLSTEKVRVRVIRSGVGAITESDVLLASATQADNIQTAVVIIGFNVRPESRAADVAKQEDVDIRLHSIIYKVEEEIRAAMIGMLDAIEKEVILGKAKVQEVFKITKIGTIAGCRVTDGLIKRTARARLIRDAVVIWDGEIDSLKRFKDDAAEVKQGFECGIGLVNYNDIKVDDEIEAYIIEKIAPTEL